MKHIYAFLFIMASLAVSAQSDAVQGACSITLTSPDETRQQFYCYEAFEPIVPITYAINGSGYTVTGLPPGITTSFSDGILTISGTPTSYGLWYHQIQTTEGCTSTINGLGFSQLSDPGLSCSNITDHSITFNWASLANQQDGDVFVSWVAGDLFGIETYFLPTDVTAMVADGLPPNTEVTFSFNALNGVPVCFPPAVLITCTTAMLGVSQFGQDQFSFSPNPAKDYLELSGDMTIDAIVFYDLRGREMKRIMSPPQRIDVSALPPAVYLMEVTGGDKVASFKFIKQ